MLQVLTEKRKLNIAAATTAAWIKKEVESTGKLKSVLVRDMRTPHHASVLANEPCFKV